MRVLIVNTSERTGGAAVAAGRLKDALINNGVKVKMLVRDKQTDDITVAGLTGWVSRSWHFLWERWCLFVALRFRRNHLFEIDIANSGTDITRLREFREADIIHLHWVNQGMLSLGVIRKILKSGKPVVWTMHDLWPATAICHYARGCRHFRQGCHDCPLLPGGGSAHDLSSRTWHKKAATYKYGNIFFVACSRWLEGQAKQSALLTGQNITSVPNAIDSRFFAPGDKTAARALLHLPTDKRIILFVAQRVTDTRKGMDYFVQALQLLVDNSPELRDTLAVAVLGGSSDELEGRIPVETYPLGYVSDSRRIVDIYNAADLFVLPSLEDNLPNTIMEAMACGVPCVGFRVGGIPEMIDHRQNGYVAVPRDAADLAEGIRWTLCDADAESLSHAAVSKVKRCYSQQSVALRYVEIYNEAVAFKRYIK